MTAALAYDQAPDVFVPLRFLAAAPLFGVAAASVLLAGGPELLASRWSAAALAVTHLFTLGFIAHSIVGAMMQFLPVASGADLRPLHRLAPLLQVTLAAGALLLPAGFLASSVELVASGGLLAAFALGAVVALAGYALIRAPARGAITGALKLSLVGLAVTVALGLALALAPGAAAHAIDIGMLANLHAAWGFAGWVSVIVFGIALAVVPMFQLTPHYPAWVAYTLPAALIAVLFLLAVATAAGAAPAAIYAAGSALLVSQTTLAWNLLRAAADYRRLRQQLAAP